MPLDAEGRAKLYADIAHPINSQCREMIQDYVINEFFEEIERSKLPGYISRYDDVDFDFHEETAETNHNKPREARVDRAHGRPTPHESPAKSAPVNQRPKPKPKRMTRLAPESSSRSAADTEIAGPLARIRTSAAWPVCHGVSASPAERFSKTAQPRIGIGTCSSGRTPPTPVDRSGDRGAGCDTRGASRIADSSIDGWILGMP